MVNRLHLIYVIIIALCIITCIIICQEYAVCETAFANFSFAATITSIVLAVVSIVYSIMSGIFSNNQMSGIREIETRIGSELNNFRSLDEKIRKSVDDILKPIRDQMNDLHKDQVGMRQSIDTLINTKSSGSQDTGTGNPQKFSFKNNSQWGNVLIYACSLSFNKKKPLPKAVFDKYSAAFTHYFFGYMVSLSTIMPTYFGYSNGNDPTGSIITVFDEGYFGKQDDIKKIVSEYSNVPNIGSAITEIEQYFCM